MTPAGRTTVAGCRGCLWRHGHCASSNTSMQPRRDGGEQLAAAGIARAGRRVLQRRRLRSTAGPIDRARRLLHEERTRQQREQVHRRPLERPHRSALEDRRLAGPAGQHSFIDFGMKPFIPGENGGIKAWWSMPRRGRSTTRRWCAAELGARRSQCAGQPVPGRYRDGRHQCEDPEPGRHDLATSWDDWAQGFHTDGHGNFAPSRWHEGGLRAQHELPGPGSEQRFFATLKNSKMWLDVPTAPATGEEDARVQLAIQVLRRLVQLNQIAAGAL